jgi:hypothetical protein
MPHHDFRATVLRALGAIGKAAAPAAVPLIIDLVDDAWVQESASRALYAINPSSSEFRAKVLAAGLEWPPSER